MRPQRGKPSPRRRRRYVRPEMQYVARRVHRRKMRPPIALPEPPRVGWAWLIAATTVPILISVFAALVSLRAYDDQRAANAAVATAAKQQYARLVSAWLISGPGIT